MSETGPRSSDRVKQDTEGTGGVDPCLARVRAVAGTEEVERLDVLPDVALSDDEEMTPVEVIRVGGRYFARMRGRPDEWWMGEIDDAGTLRVWGVYGSTPEEAVRHH